MPCYANGILVDGGGGSSLTLLVDEQEAEQTTTDAAYVQFPSSQLILPAGNWLVHYSIEMKTSSTTTNINTRVYDTVGTSELCFNNYSQLGVLDYHLHGGIKYVTGPATLQWQFYRSAGSGTGYARRARIAAVSA